MPTQDHIHLQKQDDRPWATDGVPDNTYHVVFGKMNRLPKVYVQTEIALDGTVHLHQLVSSGAGSVIRHENYKPQLNVSSGELSQLILDLGKKVDFVPIVHNDAGSDSSSYIVEMVLSDVKIEEMDPGLCNYLVTVNLEALE